MKLNLGILFGGRSGEHEISIRSAKTVIEKCDADKYNIVPLAISNEGKWLSPAESLKLFPDETQSYFNERFAAPSDDLIDLFNGERPFDVAFPVLHGTFGEDGTIQGLFEMAGIAYVGCGVLASSCGMDKVTMKTLFTEAGLPICEYVWFLRSEWEANSDRVVEQVASKLGFPCVVKPANLGSSVGVSLVADSDSLREAIDLAAKYDRKIIVEEGLDMREIECGVIGNDQPEASLPGEYIILDKAKAFLDYTEKYSGTGNNEFVVPAPLSAELTDRVKKFAVSAFKSIDGSGLARVDFFLKNNDGSLIVNEINTMPGLTDASGFPKMWQGSGRAFSQVIDDLVRLAQDRFNDKERNASTR